MPEATQTPPVSERDIAELERVLAEKRSLYERQKTDGEITAAPHGREMISEIIKEKLATTPGVQSSMQQASMAQQQPIPQPARQAHAVPSYAADDVHPKVQELVELAFSKSLGEAIELARATQNAAIIDAFHDIMVDELYDHLVETGKLEKI
jgi:hypothetical protein